VASGLSLLLLWYQACYLFGSRSGAIDKWQLDSMNITLKKQVVYKRQNYPHHCQKEGHVPQKYDGYGSFRTYLEVQGCNPPVETKVLSDMM